MSKNEIEKKNRVTINLESFKNRGKMTVQRVWNKGKIVVVVAAAAMMLAGCEPTEIATNSHATYDVIDTLNDEVVENGIQQIEDVEGENFKLVIDYRVLLDNNERWTVTADKDLYYNICTMGLPDDTKVYIDNVHIDTTIISHYPSVNGITQDTMDDRIHNAVMKGFPVSDFNTYGNICSIEGQNQSFIQGSFWGFNGYQSGEVEQKRYVESDYLKAAVTGNKIKLVVDLIIERPNQDDRCVSVGSTIGVSVWPYIEFSDAGRTMYRYYSWNSNNNTVEYHDYSPEEYYQRINEQGKGFNH